MRHGPARKNVIRIAVGLIALLLLFLLSPFGTIAAGERGVHLRFTAVTGKVFGEGLYFRVPLIESIVNFEFSKNFNDAIEAKVTAEQQALAAKNKLEQIKFEADQKIAEARGKAEAMTIESNALKSNPQILELRALEKWNGTLPQVTGGAIPFINLPK